VSFGHFDANEQVYQLALPIGVDSSETTHIINFNGRNRAFYPFQNQKWQVVASAESGGAGGYQYKMALDRSGSVYMLDVGNLDREETPIDEVLDSNFIFDRSPSQIGKYYKSDFYFFPTSSNRLQHYDRSGFDTQFTLKNTWSIQTGNSIVKKSVDIPETTDIYQFRLTSSSDTSEPWKLIRNDNFMKGLGIGNIK
jgi:hypothetical protein